MLDNTDSEYFRAEIQTSKEGAEFILSIMEEAGLEEIIPESIPVSTIKDFVENKRSNLWEITINGNSVMEVVAPKRVATAMIEAVREHGGDTFPLVPIPMDNFLGFVQGKTKNIMAIELVHLAPNAELPGHV